MLTRIKISGLRGIKEADIDGLSAINVFIGANGSGKSTVLEAVGVMCAGWNAEKAFLALAQREWFGIEGMKFWLTGNGERAEIWGWQESGEQPDIQSSVFRGPIEMDLSTVARREGHFEELAAINVSLGARRNQALINEDGEVVATIAASTYSSFALEAALVDRPISAHKRYSNDRFSSRLRDALAEIKLSPYYDDLIEYLQVIRPNLVSIESLAVGDRDEPHVFEKDPRVGYPLAYAGDGFRRSLLLAAAFAKAKKGVVAIDEPEAFSHPRLFRSVAKMILKAVDEGTQVFLATHSLEFVQAMLETCEDDQEKVAVIGLDNNRGNIDALVVSGENAYRRVVELGDDLRL